LTSKNVAQITYILPCEDLLSLIRNTQLSLFYPGKKGISRSEALDILKIEYGVYLKDEKSGFSWELMVNMLDLQNKVVDVVFKKV